MDLGNECAEWLGYPVHVFRPLDEQNNHEAALILKKDIWTGLGKRMRNNNGMKPYWTRSPEAIH